MSKIVFKDGQELHVSKEMADKVSQCSNSGRVAFSVVDNNTVKSLAVSMDDVLYVEFEKPVEAAVAPAPVEATPSAPVDTVAPAEQPATSSDAVPAAPEVPAAPAEAPADPSAVPATPAA